MNAHFTNSLYLLEPGLQLYQEGLGTGVEQSLIAHMFSRSPRVDIFAIDEQGGFVVIECKIEYANSGSIGQLASYVNLVRKRYATSGRRVRAFLVCKRPSIMVWHAIDEIPGVDFTVFQYSERDTVVKLQSPLRQSRQLTFAF